MSRSNEKREITVLAAQRCKRVEDLLFLSRHRAGDDPEFRKLREKVRQLGRKGLLHIESVILQIAEHSDLPAIGANGLDPFAIRLRLHTEQGEVVEHAF